MLQEDIRHEIAEAREAEAKRRYAAGEKPMVSTGICESLTCGYGNLDSLGYWEYPLYPAANYLTHDPLQGEQDMEDYLDKY